MSRRRYVYRKNEATGEVESFEVGQDWTDAPRSTGDLGKFEYGVTMTDGTYVGDRHDYKRYLKKTGYVPVHEFKGEMETAAKKREAYLKGESRSTPARREALGREFYRRGLLK